MFDKIYKSIRKLVKIFLEMVRTSIKISQNVWKIGQNAWLERKKERERERGGGGKALDICLKLCGLTGFDAVTKLLFVCVCLIVQYVCGGALAVFLFSLFLSFIYLKLS